MFNNDIYYFYVLVYNLYIAILNFKCFPEHSECQILRRPLGESDLNFGSVIYLLHDKI